MGRPEPERAPRWAALLGGPEDEEERIERIAARMAAVSADTDSLWARDEDAPAPEPRESEVSCDAHPSG